MNTPEHNEWILAGKPVEVFGEDTIYCCTHVVVKDLYSGTTKEIPLTELQVVRPFKHTINKRTVEVEKTSDVETLTLPTRKIIPADDYKKRTYLGSSEVHEIEDLLIKNVSLHSKQLMGTFDISQPVLSRIRNGIHKFSSLSYIAHIKTHKR